VTIPVEFCQIDSDNGATVLTLKGRWQIAQADRIALAMSLLDKALGKVDLIDGKALGAMDTAGALVLLSRLRAAGIDPQTIALANFDPSHTRIVEVVRSRLPSAGPTQKARAYGWLAQTGQMASDLGVTLIGHVDFLGRIVFELSRAVRQPGLLRPREFMAQLGQTGVSAIPVVMLVTFLIGVVFAYLLGLQAEQYGANVFVVDGTALGMTREFAPIIVAVIVAGRSGAAFTAQLGTMKLTEEIDAIRTLGLSADQVLVLPRIAALMMTLPLLVFIGDVAGLLGAMVIGQTMLDITPHSFLDRLHTALDPKHVLIGLGKAPFFALVIGIIGCRMGISVERDTRSIGINTTSTVVQSIVSVIILDAIFAVIFQQLGW
jgi:phospholipid/cholesterol/gamma-HCH transport system permease protein